MVELKEPILSTTTVLKALGTVPDATKFPQTGLGLKIGVFSPRQNLIGPGIQGA
jgi:hypothetical protein